MCACVCWIDKLTVFTLTVTERTTHCFSESLSKLMRISGTSLQPLQKQAEKEKTGRGGERGRGGGEKRREGRGAEGREEGRGEGGEEVEVERRRDGGKRGEGGVECAGV